MNDPLSRQALPPVIPDQGLDVSRFTTPLIGRTRECRVMLDAWDAVCSGGSRHVHITGAPGFGKTRLLQDLRDRLCAAGARCVTSRANPGERHVPYAMAANLAAALDPRRFPEGIGADVGAWEDALRRHPAVMAELLSGETREGPLAVLVDDVQWGDAFTRGILSRQLVNASQARVLFVTTSRPVMDGIMERDDTDFLFLEPLDRRQVLELLTSLGTLPETPWAGELAAALHRTSTGSPLLVLETLELAREQALLRVAPPGRWVSADEASLSALLHAGGALRSRVASLDRGQSWLLLVLSCAGVPCEMTALGTVSARIPVELGPDLAGLERRGLARRVGEHWLPTHDTIAEMTVEISRPEDIHAAHHALGRMLSHEHARSTDLSRAGQHFRAAGESDLLSRVFIRWFSVHRRRGDHRGRLELAREFLGTDASPGEVALLASDVPWLDRLRRH
jgi:hypothetical protein